MSEMFYRGYSLLTRLARPESLPSPRAPGAASERAEAEAQRAMGRELPAMRLSERLADPAAYLRAQRARRQALEALLRVELTPAVTARATDLICMIAEESTWSENPSGAPFDDDRHPEIDFQCAETATLFAWTLRGFGDALSSRVAGKLLYEARRRVFSPFLAHGDYPFMRGRGRLPLCILGDILLCAMVLETDEARRNALLKQATRMLDQAIAAREGRVTLLAEAAAETGAVTDLSLLLRRATRGELDLTQVYPTPDWLDALLFPWMAGDCFVDPAACAMHPPLSGEELFRIGLAANDEALTALGAQLHRSHGRPSTTVTGRLLDMSCAPMLAAESGKAPRVKRAATARNRLMVSRFDGLTCAVHAGGGRANAGDLVLFAGDRPILVETPEARNLPAIGGHGQLDAPDAASAPGIAGNAADFEVREDREQMSIDLTGAYPVAAMARSYQRTAMARRGEGLLRLVDAFDLAEPAPIVFTFATPERPERLMHGLRLGPVDLAWEGELEADIAPLGTRFPADAAGRELWRVSLTTPAPVSRAFFTFNFSAAQGQ